MEGKKVKLGEWLAERQSVSMLMAFVIATAIIFLIMLLFKDVMMPNLNKAQLTPQYMQYNERFMRSCMQETSLAMLEYGGEGVERKGIHPRLYRTIPFLNPVDAPENRTMWRVWHFCKEVYADESNAYLLYRLKEESPTLYTQQAAIRLRDRIIAGWGIGDVNAQRKILDRTISNWDSDNLNAEFMDVMDKYKSDLDARYKDGRFHRIFGDGKGHFTREDICNHQAMVKEWKVVEDPDTLFQKVGCGK